jgi:hypothetical protein
VEAYCSFLNNEIAFKGDTKMKPGRVIKIVLTIFPFLWLGCSILNPVVDQSEDTENHLHSISQTRSFGDRHYHAVLTYNDRDGVLEIKFSDPDEVSVKIMRERNVKAVLTLPDGRAKEFFFEIPASKKRSLPRSRWAKIKLRLKPKSEIIYIKKDFLKDLSNFALKVWLPVKGTTYIIKYEYPEPDVNTLQMHIS